MKLHANVCSQWEWTKLRQLLVIVLLTRVRDNDIQLSDITVRHELSGGRSLGA